MSNMFLPTDVTARKRKLHTEAEQRRRDAIKKGYDHLLELIHPIKADHGSTSIRMSKATILNRSIWMINNLAKLQNQRRMEIATLKKKVKVLQILNSNYNRVASVNSYACETSCTIVTEQIKFRIFRLFMENLFESFDAAVSECEIEHLSHQIINWMENNCKPESLRLMMEALVNGILSGNPDLMQSVTQPHISNSEHQYSTIESVSEFGKASTTVAAQNISQVLLYKPFSSQLQMQTTALYESTNANNQSELLSGVINDRSNSIMPPQMPCTTASNFRNCMPSLEVYGSNCHAFTNTDQQSNSGLQSNCENPFYRMHVTQPELSLSNETAVDAIQNFCSTPGQMTKDTSTEMRQKCLMEYQGLPNTPSTSRREINSRSASSLVVNSTLPLQFQASSFHTATQDQTGKEFRSLVRFPPIRRANASVPIRHAHQHALMHPQQRRRENS